MFSMKVVKKSQKTSEDKFEICHSLVNMMVNNFVSNIYGSS